MLLQLTYQTPRRQGKRTAQLRHIERAYKRIGQRISHGSGEPIAASGKARILTQPKTRESDDVVADPPDEVFGLPELVALDARPGVKDVEPAHPDQIRCIGLRLRLHLVRRAEERTKFRASCAEVHCCRHHHVELQTIGEQKYPRDPPVARMQIKMADHAEFLIEQVCPVVENILKSVPISNPEGEVDIRPRVTQADSGRTGQRSSRDPRIGPCQLKDTLAHPVTKLGGEHADLPAAYC